jgi:hypothetical protein
MASAHAKETTESHMQRGEEFENLVSIKQNS